MPEFPSHTPENRTRMDAFFGTVEIGGKRCGVQGCDAEPVAAMPIRTSEETGVWWFCPEHAGEFSQTIVDRHAGHRPPLAALTPTCGLGDRDAQCDGMATHLAIVGVEEHGLDLVSVCARHEQESNGGE